MRSHDERWVENDEWKVDGSLSHQEGFGVLFGDGEELEGGLAGAARALLSTADGGGADVQIGGEKDLAGLQRAADVAGRRDIYT